MLRSLLAASMIAASTAGGCGVERSAKQEQDAQARAAERAPQLLELAAAAQEELRVSTGEFSGRVADLMAASPELTDALLDDGRREVDFGDDDRLRQPNIAFDVVVPGDRLTVKVLADGHGYVLTYRYGLAHLAEQDRFGNEARLWLLRTTDASKLRLCRAPEGLGCTDGEWAAPSR